jgi:hypothetical protein
MDELQTKVGSEQAASPPKESHLTLAEAARLCGLAPVTLRQAAQRGRMQTTRVGEGRRSTLFVTQADLDAYLNGRRRGRRRTERTTTEEER